MSQSKNPLAVFAYLIVALVALVVAAGVVRFLLQVIAGIAAMLLSIIIVAAVLYVIYLMLKAAGKQS